MNRQEKIELYAAIELFTAALKDCADRLEDQEESNLIDTTLHMGLNATSLFINLVKDDEQMMDLFQKVKDEVEEKYPEE